MIGGLNPKKMQAMMKQMGMSQEEINAKRVVIEKEDGNLVIENPSVTKINMQGQESFQIVGDVSEESGGFSDEDIQTIIEKTNSTEEQTKKTLEKTGDLAEAILELSE